MNFIVFFGSFVFHVKHKLIGKNFIKNLLFSNESICFT